ncbi:M24 family metallopeptidase [Aminirod propionatiphilus]|uniref:Aminopeptidase P family protein n=1 Tax=Aminirod propionatiphilus TaxID=3415223 RepID=A0ACD1DSW3_9BACT|nr:aminopeptidase P family protein [Synergistota bacterium]
MLNRDKIAAVAADMRARGVDVFIIGTSTDLEYVSGLAMHDCERFKALFVKADGGTFCLVPHIYLQEFQSGMPDTTPLYVWEDHDWFYSALARAFEEQGIPAGAKVAVNDSVRAVDAIEVAGRQKVELVNGWHYLDAMRSHKDADEAAAMLRAGQIADEALTALLPFIRPGRTERELKRRLLDLFEEKGAQGISFTPIVARGANAAMAHYNKEDGVVGDHDTVLFDFGCRYKGYCSDMTRTLFVGEATEEERTLYEIVRRAQAAGEAAVRPGVTSQEVDRAARRVIEEAGYGAYFNNRLGHGIGLAVHETPYIMEGNEQVLEPGMTFSIEPGIYIPGKIGIRIENIVLVTDEGCRPLNVFPREIVNVLDFE